MGRDRRGRDKKSDIVWKYSFVSFCLKSERFSTVIYTVGHCCANGIVCKAWKIKQMSIEIISDDE